MMPTCNLARGRELEVVMRKATQILHPAGWGHDPMVKWYLYHFTIGFSVSHKISARRLGGKKASILKP
eukprot:SAG11_NODE_5659_length_1492_cov_2.582197_1_plen_67_part_10